MTLSEPLIAEVPSASTAGGMKAVEYHAMPSISALVVLEQTKAEATALTRSGAEWFEEWLAPHAGGGGAAVLANFIVASD
jgi:hypothetical protein